MANGKGVVAGGENGFRSREFDGERGGLLAAGNAGAALAPIGVAPGQDRSRLLQCEDVPAGEGSGDGGDVGHFRYGDRGGGVVVIGAAAVAKLRLGIFAPDPDRAVVFQSDSYAGGGHGDDTGESGDDVRQFHPIVCVDHADGQLAPGEHAAIGGTGENMAAPGAHFHDACDAGYANRRVGSCGCIAVERVLVIAKHRGLAGSPGADGSIAMDGEGRGARCADLHDIGEAGDLHGRFDAAGTLLATTEFAIGAPAHSPNGSVFQEEVRGPGGGGDIDDLAGQGNGDKGRCVAAAIGNGGAGAELAIAHISPATGGAIGKENQFMRFAGNPGHDTGRLPGSGKGEQDAEGQEANHEEQIFRLYNRPRSGNRHPVTGCGCRDPAVRGMGEAGGIRADGAATEGGARVPQKGKTAFRGESGPVGLASGLGQFALMQAGRVARALLISLGCQT